MAEEKEPTPGKIRWEQLLIILVLLVIIELIFKNFNALWIESVLPMP